MLLFLFFAGEILGSAFSVYYLLKDFMYKKKSEISVRDKSGVYVDRNTFLLCVY